MTDIETGKEDILMAVTDMYDSKGEIAIKKGEMYYKKLKSKKDLEVVDYY